MEKQTYNLGRKTSDIWELASGQNTYSFLLMNGESHMTKLFLSNCELTSNDEQKLHVLTSVAVNYGFSSMCYPGI